MSAYGTLASFQGSATGGYINYGAASGSAGGGAGGGLSVVTTASLPIVFSDVTPGGTVDVRRFTDPDGTVGALIAVNFSSTPTGDTIWSVAANAILVGLVSSTRIFNFTLCPSLTSVRVGYAGLTTTGELLGTIQDPFGHLVAGAASTTFYVRL